VWRSVKADVSSHRNSHSIFGRDCEPERYEVNLTGFVENMANLEDIHAMLTQYGHPDVVSSSQFLLSR